MASPPCNLECPICHLSLSRSSDQNSASETENIDDDQPHRELSLWSGSRWTPVCTPCGHLFHKGIYKTFSRTKFLLQKCPTGKSRPSIFTLQFLQACILEWFRVRRHHDGGSLTRGTCPTCRKSIAYHKLTKVYLPTSPGSGSSTPTSPSPTPPSEIASSSASTSPSPRVSVSNAVRRYTQQYLEETAQSNERNRERSATNRIYDDLMNVLCLNSSGQQESSGVERRRNGEEGNFVLHWNCRNPDCVAVRNVYYVLSKEYKSLQRKYELLADVSKMKSVLVTNVQRDFDNLLRKYNDEKPEPFPIFWYFIISGLTMLLCWLFIRAVAYFLE